jgi:ligand-binding SRPBCC domain-containing protein
MTVVTHPPYFAYEQIFVEFKRFHHGHLFEEQAGQTMMTDKFNYTAPLGILGKFAECFFFKLYETFFIIEKRNY